MGTDIHGVFQAKNNGRWSDVPCKVDIGRHYLLFAWLGNVRNGFGFAGVPTHTAIKSLSDCRGFPPGFCCVNETHPTTNAQVRITQWGRDRKYEQANEPINIWMGDHSWSWVTGNEVLAAEMPKILRTGVVERAFFDTWDGKSAPESWCGGISGRDTKVNIPSEVTAATTHVQIEWFEDTAETLAYFRDEVKRLCDEHGEVRFVFGFDS